MDEGRLQKWKTLDWWEAKKDCYEPWANYFVKFFESYARYDTYADNNNQGLVDEAQSKVSHPLEFWGCTVQNEPGGAPDREDNFLIDKAKVTWESMEFPPDDQAEFIGDHLGPKLDENRFQLRNDHERIKIMCYEDQKNDFVIPYLLTSSMPPDPKATLETLHNNKKENFIDGIAFHWYQKNFISLVESDKSIFNKISFVRDDIKHLFGDPFCNESLSNTNKWLHDSGFNNKFLFATEACQGCAPQSPTGPANDLDTKWKRAEEYGMDIITDLNNGTVGWMDWNLALNLEGGPNQAGNNCDALVLCDSNNDAFYMQPMFYYFAHFTKFIPPDSVRIPVDTSLIPKDVKCTAFKTPNNQIVIVVQNTGDKHQDYGMDIEEQEEHNFFYVENMPSHSIRTFVIPES